MLQAQLAECPLDVLDMVFENAGVSAHLLLTTALSYQVFTCVIRLCVGFTIFIFITIDSLGSHLDIDVAFVLILLQREALLFYWRVVVNCLRRFSYLSDD